MTALALLASNGPFGPTALTCLLLPLMLVAPFVLLALTVRSLLIADPLSRPTLGLMLLGTPALVVCMWTLDPGHGTQRFWTVWRIAGVVMIGLLAVSLLREGVKNGWFRR